MLRLYLITGAVVLVLLGGGALYVRYLQGEVREARAEAAAQTRQAELNNAGMKSVDRYTREVRVIEKQAQEAQDAVRQDPGADDVFEPAGTLCAQLERMRNEPVCTDDPGS